MSLVSSRQRLDMDSENEKMKGETAPPLTFGHQKGCYMERWMLVTLVVAGVALIAAVGLLVAFFGPCTCDLTGGSRTEAATGANQTETYDASKSRPYVMLPRSVVPEHYDVELQPYLTVGNFTFDGEVKILVVCKEATDNITVHVNDLTVDESTISITSSGRVEAPSVVDVQRDPDREFLILQLSSQLLEDAKYLVSIRFRGNLNDQLAGFYRSSYDEDGQEKWLAVTQFQPTDARRAFPCFDEPALKATFNITIVRDQNLTSISNMPIIRQEPREGSRVADIYDTTVPMSTYLLAFVVSDFRNLTSPDNKFRVWARRAAIDTAQYALDVGPRILQHFENYFNISYPLPKTDMIAVPDFNAGAMENWGLITYRETAMLYDPLVSSANNKQRVATVISHELAHQWFGNLVTPKWWDDLWLNEGFASYMEYEGVTAVEPSWNMSSQFVVDELQDVFELDCLSTSHPISVPVHHPDEINEIFDRISYGKGASIIRMMDHFLGRETFKRGVSNYLKSMKYKNSVQDDLWRFLTEAQETSGDKRINVKEVMDSWTLETGYPVVTVTRDYDIGRATLRQERFLLDNTSTSEKENTRWEIPITFTDSEKLTWNDTSTKLWLHRTDGRLSGLPSKDHWIIVNVQQVGYYRVNYDLHNWQLLIRQLRDEHSIIHEINRAQILDDALDLARAGLLDYELALNATLYLKDERLYLPWESALSSFSYLDSMLSRSSIYGQWKEYVLSLIIPLYDHAGWTENIEEESVLTQYTRINALVWACKYDHPDCVSMAKKKFEEWKTNPENMTIIPPNFRSLIYCTAIRHGTEADWNFAWEQYKKAQVASEKDKLLRSLGCAKEPWLLSRYLAMALNSESGIRRQDGSYAFAAVATNLYGRDLSFNYFRDKWNQIFEYYGKSFFALSNLVKSVTSSLNTPFDLEQLKYFYEKHRDNLGTSMRAYQQAIEKAQANVRWMEGNYDVIKKWLDRQLWKI